MAACGGSPPTPYLGSKISLISKSEIRYEGILYTVDTKESTVALAKVKSFGTEDRPTEHPVAPRDETFEFIIFKATDIKDLIVCETPKPVPHLLGGLPYDPAIVQISQPSGSPGCSSRQNSISMIGTNNSHQALTGQQTAVVRTFQNKTISVAARPTTPCMDTGVQTTPSTNKKSSGTSAQASSKSKAPPPRNVIGSRRPFFDNFHSEEQEIRSRRAMDRSFQYSPNRSFRHSPERFRRTSFRPQMRDNGPPPQHRMMRMHSPPAYVRRHDNRFVNQSMYNDYDDRSGGDYGDHMFESSRPPNVHQFNRNRNMMNTSFRGSFRGGRGGGGGGGFVPNGGMFAQPHPRFLIPPFYPGRGGGGIGATRGGIRYNNNNRNVSFGRLPSSLSSSSAANKAEDYDFEAANEKFRETLDQVKKQLEKSTISDSGDHGSLNIAGNTDKEANRNPGGIEDSSTTVDLINTEQALQKCYDKNTSFFDRISCESFDKPEGRNDHHRGNWRSERYLNTETFGVLFSRAPSFLNPGFRRFGGMPPPPPPHFGRMYDTQRFRYGFQGQRMGNSAR